MFVGLVSKGSGARDSVISLHSYSPRSQAGTLASVHMTSCHIPFRGFIAMQISSGSGVNEGRKQLANFNSSGRVVMGRIYLRDGSEGAQFV